MSIIIQNKNKKDSLKVFKLRVATRASKVALNQVEQVF